MSEMQKVSVSVPLLRFGYLSLDSRNMESSIEKMTVDALIVDPESRMESVVFSYLARRSSALTVE